VLLIPNLVNEPPHLQFAISSNRLVPGLMPVSEVPVSHAQANVGSADDDSLARNGAPTQRPAGTRLGPAEVGAQAFCSTYPARNSTSCTGSPSPNTCAHPPRVSMYSRILHTLPPRSSYTKQ
jgi:hypothetical protein